MLRQGLALITLSVALSLAATASAASDPSAAPSPDTDAVEATPVAKTCTRGYVAAPASPSDVPSLPSPEPSESPTILDSPMASLATGSPAPSAANVLEPSPLPMEPMTSRRLLEDAIGQRKAQITKTGIRDVTRLIDCIWDTYQSEIATFHYVGSADQSFSKAGFHAILRGMERGWPGSVKYGPGVVDLNRMSAVGMMAGNLAAIFSKTQNPALRYDIERAVDAAIDYGFTSIPSVKSDKRSRKDFIYKLQSQEALLPLDR